MIALLLSMLLLGHSDLEEAVRAYRAGNFAEARTHFEEALTRPDVAAGPVLYNLGNCAYREDRRAEAVLFYRRAERHLPADAEVRFNRRLAERQLGLERAAGDRLAAALKETAESLSPGKLLTLVTVLQSIGLVGLVLARRHRRARLILAALVALALPGALRLLQLHWFPDPPTAVILADEIGLRSEPHRDLPVAWTLQAGETVTVREGTDRWLHVEHFRGSGWTERAGVGLVE